MWLFADQLGPATHGGEHAHREVLLIEATSAQRRSCTWTEWFATAYVDGFRWVMPTNVIGMSQHAAGGKQATKPYASAGPTSIR